jgi:hypothetical protein
MSLLSLPQQYRIQEDGTEADTKVEDGEEVTQGGEVEDQGQLREQRALTESLKSLEKLAGTSVEHAIHKDTLSKTALS